MNIARRSAGPTRSERSAEHGFTRFERSAEHGFNQSERSAEHGFTLVEVLVALLIFGMIAGAGVALLSFSVRAQGVTSAKLDDVSAVNALSALLTADLAQAVDRPARDAGGTLLPAFTGEHDGAATPLLRLTRGGWANVDAAPRAGLQRVEYRLAGQGLERVSYPAVDGAQPLPPALVLDGVRAVTLRYRIAGAWSDRWDGTQGAALPQALELVIVKASGVTWRELFLVGVGAPPQPPEGAPTPSPTASSTPGNAT